ncbi:MAG: VWA domain-containing protein [Candidatus Thorarchaeota archaeon]|nr:VWA domain-containing protein [Candidatus Thorarchaeota archaeon]
MTVAPKISAIPSNAVDFAYEFIHRMRTRKDVRIKPSVRQTTAIPQILSARYFRNGHLTLDDFVDAAVVTTHPYDQEIARIIAEDIVLGREKEAPKLQQQISEPSPQKGENERLQKVLDQIRREQKLASEINREMVEAGYEYLQDLRQRRESKLYRTAIGHEYLNEGDVVLRGITSDQELRSAAAQELLEKVGSLSSQNILDSKPLGALEDIIESPNAAERIAAQALKKDPNTQMEFEQLAARDPSTAARALRHIEEMKAFSAKKQAEFDEMLEAALSNLSEAAEYAHQLKRMPDNIDAKIQDAPATYPLADAAEFAKQIKESTKKDIMDNILDAYNEQYDNGGSANVDLKQLSENARNTESWKELLDKKVDETIENADSRSAPSDYLRQKLREMSSMQSAISDRECKEKWEESMQKIADAAIARSPTKTHLRKTVREISRQGVTPSSEGIRQAGENLGMSEDEILELLNPSFQVIKSLIQQGVNDFDRLSNLISSAHLTHSQLQELADLSMEKDNQSALGAIAHENFAAAMGIQDARAGRGYGYQRGRIQPGAIDQNRADKVFGGLLGGPATNIVRIWYSYRHDLPPELKQRLKEIAKRLLIDLGKRYAKATMGSSMLGGIQQSTTVRPFRIGDEIELIDLEETMESLLAQGRTEFSVLDVEDFLICETYQGHRAFFWALDKSGSMHSPEKLGMLAISVMAGLYGVQKDDFGVVLFDSETHVVKTIDQRHIDVEKVATDLLDVEASGGTGGRTSLNLALTNFEETRAKEKICIFASDAYLSDQAECEKLMEKMKHRGIQVIILVPKSEYDLNAADRLAKSAHGVVLDIGTIEELPEKLLRLTNY